MSRVPGQENGDEPIHALPPSIIDESIRDDQKKYGDALVYQHEQLLPLSRSSKCVDGNFHIQVPRDMGRGICKRCGTFFWDWSTVDQQVLPVDL